MPTCFKCPKMAAYSHDGENPEYCGDHREIEMINVYAEICRNKDCKKFASYGVSGKTNRIYCALHKKKGMIDKTISRCCVKECTNMKKAIFGYKGEMQRYCRVHRKDDMIDMENKSCAEEDCMIHPTYNVPGKIGGLYCKNHAKPDMIDVLNKKCAYSGCRTNPHYNKPGEKRGIFCTKHKEPDMIQVNARLCLEESCAKQPTYNIKGEKKGIYCTAHKKKDMMNVIDRICLDDKCNKVPTFNYPNTTPALYCRQHAKKDMVNIKSKRCETKDCMSYAHYGMLFGLKRHCRKHSSPNEYINRHPKCAVEGCKTKPYWSDTNYPKTCEVHVEEGYNNIIEKACKSCGLESFINEEGKGLCNDCLDFTINKVHKSKETHIRDVLDAHEIYYDVADTIIQGGCSRYRPDFIIDNLYYTIIVEVDENQHKSYACECEIGRMVGIHQDFGGTPILFIRYNPDNYRDECDTLKKGGIQNPRREKELIKLIQKLQLDMERGGEWNKPLSVIYLFYDGYDGNQKITEIDYINNTIQEISLSLTEEN